MPSCFSLMPSFEGFPKHNKKGETFSFHMHNYDQSKNQKKNSET
jgi:hypothetical protein